MYILRTGSVPMNLRIIRMWRSTASLNKLYILLFKSRNVSRGCHCCVLVRTLLLEYPYGTVWDREVIRRLSNLNHKNRHYEVCTYLYADPRRVRHVITFHRRDISRSWIETRFNAQFYPACPGPCPSRFHGILSMMRLPFPRKRCDAKTLFWL